MKLYNMKNEEKKKIRSQPGKRPASDHKEVTDREFVLILSTRKKHKKLF